MKKIKLGGMLFKVKVIVFFFIIGFIVGVIFRFLKFLIFVLNVFVGIMGIFGIFLGVVFVE